MLTIDGSIGEGGGQVLRTSLSLSLVTGKTFRMTRIRAKRKRPGLLRQHLTAVVAAAAVGRARVSGASLGSEEITFEPQTVAPGDYRFSVGTAGSTTLVLQTVLPALLNAAGPTSLTIEGGTHNPMAPPFDFLELVFCPILRRMGPQISAILEEPGFFPAGGGRIRVRVEPLAQLSRVDLRERGGIRRIRGRAVVSGLARHVAVREVKVIGKELGLGSDALEVVEIEEGRGPGNVAMILVESEALTELFTAFGRRGVPAEKVAGNVVAEAREYLEAGVPVGRNLADQLLIPMALAGGGSFLTLEPSSHTATNVEVIRRFLEVEFRLAGAAGGAWSVEVGGEGIAPGG